MKKILLACVSLWVCGCEEHTEPWCYVTVGQEAVDELGIDPAYLGMEVCTGGFDKSTCRAAGGEPETVDGRDRGFEKFCQSSNYTVDCGDVFLRDGETCADATTGG